MLSPAASKLGRVYGCKPPKAGHHLLKSAPRVEIKRATKPAGPVDWRPMLLPPRDQGQKGYCFAFATAALKEFNCAKWSGYSHPIGNHLSPDYIGWRTQIAEGTFGQDAGGSLSDAMAVLQAYGVCPESFLPYSPDPAHRGNAQTDTAAHPYRVGTPCSVPVDTQSMCAVLESKRVIAIGFAVHASFEDTGPDGVVPPVVPGEGLLGGHAVLVVGYRLVAGEVQFIVRNSWGSAWAAAGHCYMPASYLANVFDAWTTA
ncbi:MAG: C1 family peptidase [Pseudarthrobacter sp.]